MALPSYYIHVTHHALELVFVQIDFLDHLMLDTGGHFVLPRNVVRCLNLILTSRKLPWVVHSRRDTFQAHSIPCVTLYICRSTNKQKLHIAYTLPVTCNNIVRARGLNWVFGKGILTVSIDIRYFFPTRATSTCLLQLISNIIQCIAKCTWVNHSVCVYTGLNGYVRYPIVLYVFLQLSTAVILVLPQMVEVLAPVQPTTL